VAIQLTVNGPATSAPSNSIDARPVVQDKNQSMDDGNSDQKLKAELERSLKVILLLLEGLLLMTFLQTLVKYDLWIFIKANSITLPVLTKPRTKPGKNLNLSIPTSQCSISLSKELILAILQDSKVLAKPIVASIHNLVHEICSYPFQNWLPVADDNRHLVA
jgi:hypothetical protein